MPAAHDIALVISDLGGGGAQRVATQLAGGWQKTGRRIAVITMVDSCDDFFRLPLGITRVSIGGMGDSHSVATGLAANLSRIMRLRRALRQANAPIAVAFMTQTAILTVLAAVGLNLQVIACERNDPSRQSFGPIWERLRRVVYPRATKVTANSRGALTSLSQFVPRNKLAYVPNPLAMPLSDERLQLTAPTIVAVGRLHYQKGLDVLMHAFARFRAEHKGWRLAFVGQGREETRLRSLATRLEIADEVDWMGMQLDPFPLLRSAHIFALPSRYEGMPNALLEAMSCGLPCVVSDASPGPLELIEHEKTGLVVASEDPAALSGAFARLAKDSQLCSCLGKAAEQRAAKHVLPAVLAEWDELLGLSSRQTTATAAAHDNYV